MALPGSANRIDDAVSACLASQARLPVPEGIGRPRTVSLDGGRVQLVGHGPFIDAVRAGRVCTGRQAQNHRAHHILRFLLNLSNSLLTKSGPLNDAESFRITFNRTAS